MHFIKIMRQLLYFRDVFHQGSCDDGCQLLADELGWGVSVLALVRLLYAYKSSGLCIYVKHKLKL